MIQLALTLCKQLDAIDDGQFTELDEMVGGVDAYGFAPAFEAALDRIEERMIEDATGEDYNPCSGGNDPSHYISSWLEYQIEREQDRFVRDFVVEAQRQLGLAVV